MSKCVGFQVLTNGDKVKLQRNALSVIEAPSGHEEENQDNPFSSGTSLGFLWFQATIPTVCFWF
jgi:hypothetical protein